MSGCLSLAFEEEKEEGEKVVKEGLYAKFVILSTRVLIVVQHVTNIGFSRGTSVCDGICVHSESEEHR